MKTAPNIMTELYPLPGKLFCGTTKENLLIEKVLYQDKTTREVLFTNHQGIATIYTTILKNNEHPSNDGITEVEKAIQQGEPFEKAFRRRGYIIRKNVLDVYTVSLRSWIRKEFATTQSIARAKSTEIIIKRGELIRNYAVITEIFSPDLYTPEVTEQDRSQFNFSFTSLQAAGFSKQEIWLLMDNEVTSWLTPVKFEYI
jgi:hypothetical protein